MKLQELIDSTNLDMTIMQVKAFFLGILCAEVPLSYNKALDELLSETPEAQEILGAPLKELWNELSKNLKTELDKIFPDENEITTFMEVSKDQLDYFLTGMSLSGTSIDSCRDESLAELIEELEDTVEDMDDFLADSEATKEDGEDFKNYLVEMWTDFTSAKK